MNTLYVCGAGSGDPAQVTPEVTEAVSSSRAVACAPRLAHLAAGHPNVIEMNDFKECFIRLHEELKLGDAAVLVSGDTGIFSLLPLIKKNFPDAEITALPGISSLQTLCAKACETWQDAVILSGHGREIDEARILDAAEHNRSVIFFCDARHDPAWLCSVLKDNGFGEADVTVGERFGSDAECVSRGTAEFLSGCKFDPLSIVLIINGDPSEKPRLIPCDADFIRGATPMTHEEVRSVILGKLMLSQNETLWDLGAGTGSVTAAAARLCARVYAVDSSAEAAELVRSNVKKFHLHNVTVIHGAALAAADDLPLPDAVFIGGSGSELPSLLKKISELGPGIRVAVSAVSLKTIAVCTETLDGPGFEDFDAAQVSVSRLKTVGKTKIWSAQNPVCIFTARTAGEEK